MAKDTTSFRRELFQAKLGHCVAVIIIKAGEGPDASKTAALCAALCIVDTPSMQGHPFGGFGAAWCWLARAADEFVRAEAARGITSSGGVPGDGGALPLEGLRAAGRARQLLGESRRRRRRRCAAANPRQQMSGDLVDRAARGD